MKPLRLVANLIRHMFNKPLVQTVHLYMKSGNVIVFDNVKGEVKYEYRNNTVTALTIFQMSGSKVAVQSIALDQIEGIKCLIS